MEKIAEVFNSGGSHEITKHSGPLVPFTSKYRINTRFRNGVRKVKVIKNGTLFVSLLLMAAVNGPVFSGKLKKCDELKKDELEIVVSGIGGKLFHIKIFDGLLPVPTRYAINVDGTSNISLMSPPEFEVSNYKNICLSGTFQVGKYTAEMDAIFSKFKREKIYVHDRYSISENLIHKSEPYIKYDVFIQDGDEFLLMTDTNRDLWKVMFNELLKKKGIEVFREYD